ncbi:hypothetical protein ScalyP_jg1989 [Parmales sp. scaly parma]|nr:hypothetical protein ScalyP_jg1989 [Parmales sp. scaly parma]
MSTLTHCTPCPLILITGFLGSGKSTLINSLLTSVTNPLKLAIIENEFGDSGEIERLIMEEGAVRTSNGTSTENTILEMPNGCICCSLKSDLLSTIEGLFENGKNTFDAVLIELSGLADPGPVLTSLWSEGADESSPVTIGGVVTLVDCNDFYNGTRVDGEGKITGLTTIEGGRQLGYADRVLLTKTDLLSNNDLSKVKNFVNEKNPTASLELCTRGSNNAGEEIIRRVIFGERPNVEKGVVGGLMWGSDIFGPGPNFASISSAQNHLHTENVTNFSVKFEGGVRLGEFKKWLAQLLWGDNDDVGGGIWRIKGMLNVLRTTRVDESGSESEPESESESESDDEEFEGSGGLRATDTRYVLQVVGDLFELKKGAGAALKWKEEELRCCSFVFIGKGMKEDEIDEIRTSLIGLKR